MIDLKLDTLHKKPKVYSLLWLTAAAAALLGLWAAVKPAQGRPLEFAIVMAYFLGVSFLLLRGFFLQMRYNLYSYNTIIYFGFGVFSLFVANSYGLLLVRLWDLPPEAVLRNVIGTLSGSAVSYAVLTFPFLALFALGLMVSNLSLIRREGFRPVNLLGIVLGLLLVAGDVVIFLVNRFASGSVTEVMLHDLAANLMAVVYLYFECMLLGTIVAGAIAAKYEPAKDKDYLIVLGCGIRRDGTPTPLLRGRLDRALDFARAQETQTGKAPVFVVSGGQGLDEVTSEAACMAAYLTSKGVPRERIRLEDRSTDTLENMRFSKEIIWAENPGAVVGFSTNDYHVFRSGLKARRVKMRALGMGSRSKWYFWPNAAVREFVGLLTQHRVKQGLILLGLILSSVLLTILHYKL